LTDQINERIDPNRAIVL